MTTATTAQLFHAGLSIILRREPDAEIAIGDGDIVHCGDHTLGSYTSEDRSALSTHGWLADDVGRAWLFCL